MLIQPHPCSVATGCLLPCEPGAIARLHSTSVQVPCPVIAGAQQAGGKPAALFKCRQTWASQTHLWSFCTNLPLMPCSKFQWLPKSCCISVPPITLTTCCLLLRTYIDCSMQKLSKVCLGPSCAWHWPRALMGAVTVLSCPVPVLRLIEHLGL